MKKLPKILKILYQIYIKLLLAKKKFLEIYGKNHKTKDGTCVRDFIHINDLVNGHISALNFLKIKKGWFAFNLGTGKGYTVLEVIKCFQKILKSKIRIKYTRKRKGDLSISYADVKKAKKYLRWRAKFSLFDMCKSFCRWKKLIKT